MTNPPPHLREELDRFGERYRLTAREHDVLCLLVTGYGTVPEIAARLELSGNTVHNHFKNVFRRTRTNTKAALLALFLKEALDRQAGLAPFIRTPRVLLVEPERSERERLARALGEYGVETEVEADSGRVVDRVAQERFDVVVADLALPGSAGRGVLDDILARFGRWPAVLLTSQAPVSAAEWIARGAGDVLMKPVGGDRLCFAVFEHFVDSTYTRSRLVRVDAALQTRIDDVVSGRIDNLGFGGAFVSLEHDEMQVELRFAIGSRVKLAFALDDQRQLKLLGEVRWRRDGERPASAAGVGLQFVDMRDEQRQLVEEFVRRRKLADLERIGTPSVRRAV